MKNQSEIITPKQLESLLEAGVITKGEATFLRQYCGTRNAELGVKHRMKWRKGVEAKFHTVCVTLRFLRLHGPEMARKFKKKKSGSELEAFERLVFLAAMLNDGIVLDQIRFDKFSYILDQVEIAAMDEDRPTAWDDDPEVRNWLTGIVSMMNGLK